jgi:hypothetical protein
MLVDDGLPDIRERIAELDPVPPQVRLLQRRLHQILRQPGIPAQHPREVHQLPRSGKHKGREVLIPTHSPLHPLSVLNHKPQP